MRTTKIQKTKEEITSIIKDALREIRFNDGRGYFFVDTLEGDVILYPVYSDSEGQNLIELQDEKGNFLMKEEIQLVKTQGEGYIEGYWKNPSVGDEKTYKKITFVKAFEPYGWYLGCGDYLDEITKKIQREVLEYVDSIQYGEDGSQYVFIHDYSGVELANGVYLELIGTNNYDLEDINGSKVLQEQIHMCIETNGGYLTHFWQRVEGDGSYKKLTYVAPLREWEWVIGTGMDVTDLDELTGIYNRRYIKEIFDKVLVESSKTTGMILMDIDYFKKVNDNFGHKVGDEALVIIARLIENNIPERGVVGRFGGEEFIIIIPEISLEETIEVAETIRKSIETNYIEAINGYITISGGVAHSSSWDKEELFKQADKKLYLAKDLGRNRTEF